MKPLVAVAALLLVACTHVQQAPAAVNPDADASVRCEARVAEAVDSARAPMRQQLLEARQRAAADRRLVGRQIEDTWRAEAALARLLPLAEELGNLEAAARLLTDPKVKPVERAEALDRLAGRLVEIKVDLESARRQVAAALLAGEERYVDAHGVPTALAASLPQAQEQCDKGHVASCVRLAQAYEHGAGVAADPTWAVSFYGTACTAGDAYACYRGAVLQLDGPPNVRSPEKGTSALQRACELHHADGCARLAAALEGGAGVPADLARAAGLLREACLGGATDACVRLALKRQEGAGVARDLVQAANLLQLACDAEDPFACSHLGEMYLSGNGVALDRERGLRLLTQGCAAGNAWACKLVSAAQRPLDGGP